MSVIVPPIKCQGIKTKLVGWIQSKVPLNFDGVWYEPFMGSGVVGFNVQPKKAVFADTNPHIIQFYNDIKNLTITSEKIKKYLIEQDKILKDFGDIYYREVRERFNAKPNSFDFLFLNRSCFNGIMRFNKKGGFNVPFCHNKERFSKSYITKIVNQIRIVSDIIRANDYEFCCATFETTIANVKLGDIIYCDPPYIDRHSDYFNSWTADDENKLFNILNKTEAKFILSTWHHNKYRKNIFLDNYFGYNIDLKDHFYHVGANEKNRSSMVEGLITNYKF